MDDMMKNNIFGPRDLLENSRETLNNYKKIRDFERKVYKMKKDLESLLQTIKTQLDEQRKLRDNTPPFSIKYEIVNSLIARMEWEYMAIRNILEKNKDVKFCTCPTKPKDNQ